MTKRTFSKANKPSPDFVLSVHPKGYWCKRIRGTLRYFGRIDTDPTGAKALVEYRRVKDDLACGLVPGRPDEVSLGQLCNQYLDRQHAKVEAGELSPTSFSTLRAILRRLVDALGRTTTVATLGPADFARARSSIARRCGMERLKLELVQIRCMFKWACRERIISKLPFYGGSFDLPSANALRIQRGTAPRRDFDASEIRRLLEHVKDSDLRAMILFGMNAGYGPSDLAQLRADHIRDEWVEYPRPKTGIRRRCWLWPETRKSLAAWLSVRPKPADKVNRVFVKPNGKPWATATGSTSRVSGRFREACEQCGIDLQGRGMYGLRHTHRHVSDGAGDPTVCDLLMGHVDNGMAAVYRGRVADDRIKAVCVFVRQWLFGQGGASDDR